MINESITCACGKHEGVGKFPNGTMLSAGDRAARYQRIREKLPAFFTPAMGEYLQSWEAEHGKVIYDMRNVGVASGSFLERGADVMAPRNIGADKPAQAHWQDKF